MEALVRKFVENLAFLPSSSGGEPDENCIRRHILDCFSVLLQLQRNQKTLKSFESKVFWAAISSVAEMGSNPDEAKMKSNGNIIAEILSRNFPSSDTTDDAVPLESSVVSETDHISKRTDASSWLCLHWIGATGARFETDELASYLGANSRALQTFDNQKNKALPTHYAAAALHPNMSTISIMTDLCPRLVYEKDANGWLSLHYAAKYPDSVKMLTFLLQLYPAASSVFTEDDDSLSPFYLLFEGSSSRTHIESMLECLLEADSTVATKTNMCGETVLYNLCRSKRPDRESLARICLRTAPALATITDSGGRLPLHIVKTSTDGSALDLVQLLLEAYKEAASMTHDDDDLPLHNAASVLDLESVKCIVDAYPQALSICTAGSGSPLCCAAARKDAEGLSVVKYLYEKAPDMIKFHSGNEGLPTHDAAARGSVDILRCLLKVYPVAAATPCIEVDQLPLHCFMYITSPLDPCNLDKIRILLRYHSAAASAFDSDG
jgi:hypothetical protein